LEINETGISGVANELKFLYKTDPESEEAMDPVDLIPGIFFIPGL
jgi:hypothetical protein